MRGNCSVSENLLASQEDLYCMEFLIYTFAYDPLISEKKITQYQALVGTIFNVY